MMDEDNYRNNGRAGDDPQAAFEQLRGEVALVRLAVEGLARARESIEIPDYQPTLANRSEEHTSELQSLMRISYAVFCLKKKIKKETDTHKDNKSRRDIQQ